MLEAPNRVLARLDGSSPMRKNAYTGPGGLSRARRLVATLGLAGALCTAVLWTLLSSASAAPPRTTQTFSFTGGERTFTVPQGVSSLDVVAGGGKGGKGSDVGPFIGGAGGLFRRPRGSPTGRPRARVVL